MNNNDWYTYVLNNPLKFTDPSGYSYQQFLAAEALNDYNPTGEAFNTFTGEKELMQVLRLTKMKEAKK